MEKYRIQNTQLVLVSLHPRRYRSPPSSGGDCSFVSLLFPGSFEDLALLYVGCTTELVRIRGALHQHISIFLSYNSPITSHPLPSSHHLKIFLNTLIHSLNPTPIISILGQTPSHNTTKTLSLNNLLKFPRNQGCGIPSPENLAFSVVVVFAAEFGVGGGGVGGDGFEEGFAVGGAGADAVGGLAGEGAVG